MSMASPDCAQRAFSNIAIEVLNLSVWDPPSPDEGGALRAAFSFV
jgi:hypothetical protein